MKTVWLTDQIIGLADNSFIWKAKPQGPSFPLAGLLPLTGAAELAQNDAETTH